MSCQESPTLKALLDTGFALSQAISKKMSSSAPLSQSRMPIFSSKPGLATDLATPRPRRTKMPGPATQLFNDLFDELDELDETDETELIEDSTYINVHNARKRAGRLGHRTRPRIETSFKTNSLDLPHQLPTLPSSPDHFPNSSINYSHLNLSLKEDLQNLAEKFGDIQSRNKQIIEAGDETIWNSLPSLNTGYFSDYAKLRGSAKAYEQESQDTLRKEKEIYESTPGFINSQMPGLSAAEMRKQIPRLIIADAEYEYYEEDEDEKNAIDILEALFEELGKREPGSSEEEWKSAEQIIEEVENKGKDKGKEKAVATGDIEDNYGYMDHKSGKSHGLSHDSSKSREINIIAELAEQADDEIRQYSAITQQYIEDRSATRELDKIIDQDEGQLVESQQQKDIEPEVTPSLELREKDEEESTKSQQDFPKISSIMESPEISDGGKIKQEYDSDRSIKEDEDSKNSPQDHDTLDNQNLDVAEILNSITSSNSSISSDSTSSIDGGTSEEEDELQFGMAAVATGVLVATLWMIERKTRF